MNPAERAPVDQAPFPGIETGRGFSGIIPSAWWGDWILVPIARSVTALDPHALGVAQWSRAFGEDGVVSGLVVLPPSEALVLVASNENGGTADNRATLHRVDLATGDDLQRIPLPGTIRTTTGTGRVGFQPLDDGRLLVYSLDGRLIELGPADAELRPDVRVTNEYPAPNEGVALHVASRAAATFVVAWGDGAVEEGAGPWTHRYGEEGPRTVRVTALLTDGRTATTEVLLRVGATPPAELNALQRAFAPDNQNATFGVLGILVTLIGALVALVARRRRHGRLHDELEALERIRHDGRRDPEAGMRALGAFRERLLADVRARRLDDAQFNTLDQRANVVFSALRTRLLGPLAGHLSADFRHALDVVLHDGRVDSEELAALRRALDAERSLAPDERARLAAMLERMARFA